jgi:hypothetical protein
MTNIVYQLRIKYSEPIHIYSNSYIYSAFLLGVITEHELNKIKPEMNIIGTPYYDENWKEL